MHLVLHGAIAFARHLLCLARCYIRRGGRGCARGVSGQSAGSAKVSAPAGVGVDQAGFSLIEVMVTLVVLGIGMLGLAALQITGMRVNDGALMRTRAVMAATDLADRIRAQPSAFIPSGGGAGTLVSLTAGACESPPACNDAVSCWKMDFCARYQPDGGPQELPPPSAGNIASLSCGAGSGCGDRNCAIVIRWSDERAGQSDPGGGGDTGFRFCTRMP
jgi:type IV pilus assembly protein PilV